MPVTPDGQFEKWYLLFSCALLCTAVKTNVSQLRLGPSNLDRWYSELRNTVRIYTGRCIMFCVITNIYNKETKGPTLMEFFTAIGKLKKFTIFKFFPHARQHADACVARTWISYRCVPCHPWCTHRTSLVIL